MKKSLYFICCVTMLLATVSCEDFLDEAPKSSLTPENSFTTYDDWNNVLTGAYAATQLVFAGKETVVLGSFGTDEVEPFDMGWAAYAELKLYTLSSSHPFLNSHYVYCYDGIKRCNSVLDMPSDAPVTGSKRDQMMAQAKFLRAVFYFELVKMYGGVPIWKSAVVDPDQIMKPRSSVDDVYELIVSDMEYAASTLPEKWADASVGRATKHAANALLGRVFLQWGKPAEAIKALEKVEGKYKLYADYEDIFLPEHKNENYENIFEVQFQHSGAWGLEGSLQANYWGPRNAGGPTEGGGWGGFGSTQYLYDSYSDDDRRKEDFFWTEFKGVVQTPPCIKKYYDPNYGTEIEDDDLNYILIRYADVLLMMAEAYNEVDSDKKYECLNQVRRRAEIPEITSSDNLTNDQFADVVLKERLLELCCEHHRRSDLLRFGKLAEQVNAAHGVTITTPKHLLYPIPQTAMDANDKITENNPGY